MPDTSESDEHLPAGPTPGADAIRAARAEAEATGVQPASPSAPLGERAGDEIGRYTLLREIGAGGMGSVWMAEQREPVRRKVALKIIKLGMDTREVVVRFEAERQALALMDHPHIAKVFDGGATRSGRPYFVMELVEGTPITEHCDAARAGLRERLELFVKVCEAVQHAHQKGVIHRDIKPGNVLVTLHDGVPVPKVIDFGIAKATSAELTRKTMVTEHAQILGTPEYMAPEQAAMSGLDIDTRADVYSLGVLLYELLTGSRPFDIRKVLEQGFQELLRTIREEEPMRPSTRVSTAAGSASSVALGQQVNVETLSKRLRGDLDWVVMKAIEKDRDRRYETASALAEDIERYLRDEPVVAAPPSATYRLRKLVRRRKKTFAALAITSFLLAAGSIGTGVGWWNTKRANEALAVALDEKDDALAEEARQRALAQESESRARAAEEEALARAGELEQVAAFQAAQLGAIEPELMGTRLRDALLEAAPEDRREALTANLADLNFTSLALSTLEQNLFDTTIEAIDTQFEEQPVVRARLLHTAAKTMLDLGLVKAAEDPARRAVSIRRTELGDDHPDTLSSIALAGDQLKSQGRLDEAEPYLLEALEGRRRVLGDEHPTTLALIGDVGNLLSRRGRFEEAEAYLQEALEGQRRVYGDEHPSTLATLYNLGTLCARQGRFELAEAHHLEVLEHRRRTLGEDHAETLGSKSSLASIYVEQGKYEQAEAMLREALDGMRRVLGDDHPRTIGTLTSLSVVLMPLKRWDLAEPFQREAYERSRRVLGDEHQFTLSAIANLGYQYRVRGRNDEAEPYYREALELKRQALGDGHPDTLVAIHNMGCLLVDQGHLEEAQACFREALDGRLRAFGVEHRQTDDSIYRVGDTGERLVAAARQSGDDERLGRALARSGSHRLLYGDPAAAEAELREALELLGPEAPRSDVSLQRATSELGAALAAQGRAEEAEPHLLKSARWALDTPPPESEAPEVTREIVRRLIDHYEVAADATEAEAWRSRLADWAGAGDE